MCSGPAGSEQVKAGGCRARSAFQHVQNEPPTDSRDGLLKVVSRVPSPASQGGSEGGLQPDGAASKRSPQHRRNGKKKSLITFYTFFQKLLFWKKRRIFFFFFLLSSVLWFQFWSSVSAGQRWIRRHAQNIAGSAVDIPPIVMSVRPTWLLAQHCQDVGTLLPGPCCTDGSLGSTRNAKNTEHKQ